MNESPTSYMELTRGYLITLGQHLFSLNIHPHNSEEPGPNCAFRMRHYFAVWNKPNAFARGEHNTTRQPHASCARHWSSSHFKN
jgi:hypothetical protein